MKAICAPELYLLTNADPLPTLLKKLEQVFASQTVSVLQIRRKQHQDDMASLCSDIEAIMALARGYNVQIVINDYVHLAKKFGTGVHLGKEDTKLQSARRMLGADALIGQTCYQSLSRLDTAITHKASYVSLGAVFPSSTKPLAQQVTMQQLRLGAKLCTARRSKLCVIGGISTDNAALLKGIDIAYLAVSADILGQPLASIAQKCQQWQQLLATWQVRG